MSRYKYLEIRDRATCIPVIAIEMKSSDEIERAYLERSGYGEDYPLVMLINIAPRVSVNYDPYKWDNYSRTMKEAHIYIQENFSTLKSGDVVDVEYILGESEIKKLPEIYTTDSADPLSGEIIKAMFRIAEGINNK